MPRQLRRGFVQVYTGGGKGKTTAALGLALRALGQGLRVYMIQFLKKGFKYGEISALEHFPNFKFVQCGRGAYLKKPTAKDVELAGKAHFQFEKVHPFGDGNGRIGRLLMNHILWNAGYPMLIIEYKKRSSYYKALTKGEDGFVKYFIRRYLAVHKRRLK